MKRASALFLAVLAIAAACKTKRAPGEIIVAIDSDLTPGVDFDELHLDVITPTGPSNLPTIKEFGQRRACRRSSRSAC